MPYFPMIARANPVKRYSSGEYRAVLLDRVRSAQTIQYNFLLIVHRGDDETPCLAVASEYSDFSPASEPFLGVFPGDGHLNMGTSSDWADLGKFEARALEIARDRLGFDPDPDTTVMVRKPWWKFW